MSRIHASKPSSIPRRNRTLLQNIVRAITKPRAATEKKRWLLRFSESCGALRTVLSLVLLLLVFTVVGLLCYLEYQKEVVLIDPFTVPADLDQRGLNSHVIASSIADEISLMRRAAANVKTTRFSPAFSETFPDLEIPETKLSLKFVIQYIRETFGRAPTRINGELISADKTISLSVRILTNNRNVVESNVETFPGEIKDLKTLISRAAQFIMKHEDPYILARYQYNENQLDAALDTVRYAAFHHPADAAYHKEHDYWTYILWASILVDKGDTDGAIKKYEAAIDLDRQNATAYINWGYALERARKYDEALGKYQFACGIQNKDAAYGCNNWGSILETQGNRDDAQAKYNEALRLDPELVLAHVNLGRLSKIQGKKAEAIEHFEKAVAIDPLFADAYNEWGNFFADNNKNSEAIEMYRKAVDMNPNFSIAYNNLGYALEKQGKRDEAIKNYRIALDKDSSFELAYLNWGNLLYSQRKYDAALEKYKKAAELPNESSMGYHNWGYILLLQNKIEVAIEKFHKALDLNAANMIAYKSWATALRRKKDYPGAIEKYKKAFEVNPDYLDTINDWADLLIKMKDYNAAIEKCRFIIGKDQHYALAYSNWGDALKAQGAYREAIDAYQNLIALNSDKNIDKNLVRRASKEVSLLQKKLARSK